MARKLNRLTAVEVRGTDKKGMFHDGGGLYLQVSASGAKSWIFRFTLDGRAREMGLGPVHAIPLAEARKRAAECRRMRLDGIDPIKARSEHRSWKKLEAAKGITFAACAAAYLDAHQDAWRNALHRKQWRTTLNNYAGPVFGSLPVQEVDLTLVMKALEPIWRTKCETASRVRGRIEAVLDWATVRGYRTGENPARWRGHLDKLLPARAKIQKVQHHPALPYVELADFMEALRGQHGIAARALEFLILTAARTGEIVGGRWDEVDLEEKIWTVPGERMKAGREHRVPLSAAALAILKRMKETRESDFVFPGGKKGMPLSNMAMLAVLKRMGRDDLTAHGFRSTFRDWAAECTDFRSEVVEMALAHTIENKVEAAYRRGDLFQKRRQLMEAWARFCAASKLQDEIFAITRRI
ncbi:MAG TPA: integrase arm-type DNA-binding domain-containing protein [Silvibacterium sp.]|nr:integrase arm-type DNA-binding domain-containing protein [Silvibacterium sp.]